MNVYHGFYFDTDKEPYVAVIWVLISVTSKHMVLNHAYYGYQSVLVWYLFRGRKLLMVYFHGPDKNNGT